MKSLSPKKAKNWRAECIYGIGNWLAAYRHSTGWSTAGLARELTRAGWAEGLRISASTIENLEQNRFGDSSLGSFRHSRKPWPRTLKILLLIECMPDEIRSMVDDLLDYERRCLGDEIAIPGSLPRTPVPAT